MVDLQNEFAKNAVCESSISQIKRMLDQGKLTSLDLCNVYVERIKKYDKSGSKLNSIIFLNKNYEEQAKILDEERANGHIRGALHGIPILVKDNIDVAGFPTTCGNALKEMEPCVESAEVVKLLCAQGAIILGKTNMSTDDLNSRHTISEIIGQTLNPYNTAYSSGGSSGGSAVAVSASFAAAALGTDTNCSLLYPAALNSTVAFRPTFSSVSYVGCENINRSRDTVGPIAKSTEDCALIMDILTENTDSMPFSKAVATASIKGKTFAVLKELYKYTYNSIPEFKNADSEITDLFDKAVEDLKAQGANVVTISIPSLFLYSSSCRESLSTSDSAKAKFLSELTAEMKKENADAVIFPAFLSTPLSSKFDSAGNPIADRETYLNCSGYLPSILGLPSVCVPMGYLSSKVPCGIEMVSLKNTDARLLSYAAAYEKATEHRKFPSLVPSLNKSGELVFETQSTSSEQVSENISEQPSGQDKKGDYTAILIVGAALILLCIWALIMYFKWGSKSSVSKTKRF